MTNIVSRLSFYAALVLSSLLTLMLLSAVANFGLGQLIAGGPTAIFIAAVMLLNPVIFGLLGFIKGSPRWQLVAAGAMLTLVLVYTLFVLDFWAQSTGDEQRPPSTHCGR